MLLDVHLMVEPVDEMIQAFAKAGADIITFHPEASRHIDRSLSLIRDSGCRAGLEAQPCYAGACVGARFRQARCSAADVGEPRFWRAEIYSAHTGENRTGTLAHRTSTPPKAAAAS